MIPRITFGIIVLNGEPFTRYNLRALYPFAHQIIVVEGASPKAAHAATPNGHSTDGTLDTLWRFKREEDPEGKVIIVTAEDDGYSNGFWPGEKDEQSQAYAKRAMGDWLWQVDIDEFYQPEDVRQVCDYLLTHPDTTCLAFNLMHFWGGFDYLVEGGLFMSHRFLGEPWGACRRVFRWRPGYQYVSHRPPTIHDSDGRDITARTINITRRQFQWNIYMYHYFMVFTTQVIRKGRYYDNQGWHHEDDVEERYQRLFTELREADRFQLFTHWGTHNWLRRFTGHHPPAVEQLREDLSTFNLPFEEGPKDDIERIITAPGYNWHIKRLYFQEWVKAVSMWLWFMLRKTLKNTIFPILPKQLQIVVLRMLGR